MVTTMPDRPRGAMPRAYDQENRREIGVAWMPAPQSGSPMTFVRNGKHYLIVAVSGGKLLRRIHLLCAACEGIAGGSAPSRAPTSRRPRRPYGDPRPRDIRRPIG